MVKYLIETCEVYPDTTTLNSSGNLEVAQYLIEKCDVDPNTTILESAAYRGKIDMVKYLIE